MNSLNCNPSLFQVNTRVVMHSLGVGATLRHIADDFLDEMNPYDYVWLLGVWQTGEIGPQISKTHPDLQSEYHHTLPDLTEDDICGSPFAVYDYTVNPDFGGDEALREFRSRCHARGKKLILDFVPNHMAIDHPWISSAPDNLVRGPRECAEREPWNWFLPEVLSSTPLPAVAHGRDPFFNGWTDTSQLNYRSEKLQQAMIAELVRVAQCCDGVRCDMAMLLLPDIFTRTWGAVITPGVVECFWTKAIQEVRRQYPSFMFMAEVYWDLESEMIRRGFDYAYDKRLYDRLLHTEACAPYPEYDGARQARSVRGHLSAEYSYQQHMARFLENHDEPRVASKVSIEQHKAASAITYCAPGLRFFHQGQFEGKKVRIPVHLRRGPLEVSEPELIDWYRRLVPLVTQDFREFNSWQLLHPTPAWSGNQSCEGVVATAISTPRSEYITAVNYTPNRAECFIPIPFLSSFNDVMTFRDVFSGEEYLRTTEELRIKGLFLSVPPWKVHIFHVK